MAKNLTVRDRKKQLVKELVHNNPTAAKGMKVASVSIILIIAVRIALAIYEAVFFTLSGVGISLVSNLLILPGILVLYMVYDGNKALTSVTMISAFIRIIYYFSTVYSTLPETTGTAAYTGVYITVMLFQFLTSIFISENPSCKEYCNIMQRINFRIRSEMTGKK